MECPYHEPLYTGVLGITNGILHHGYSKNVEKNVIKMKPWPYVILRFHHNPVSLGMLV